jgi:low temperature requirement protein LtrA
VNDFGIVPTRRRAMTGRATDGHRAATPLELFFDLAFVVAIAFAAKVLHHDVVEHHYADGLAHFATAFFAIWWAWMNYTWFASAFDTDDVPFRLLTMVQMMGVVVMAVGISEGGGFGGAQVVGYVIMRCALVAQWLRASREDPTHRTTARRYAAGIVLAQLYWILAVLTLPESLYLPGFALGVVIELSVPRYAERAGMTPWHPHHIAERYGLLVIIVLGEGVLGMTNALASSIHVLGWTESLVIVAPASIALLLGMWWAYFLAPYGERLAVRPEQCWKWGYGHVFIFAALAALGAGLEVAETAIEHPEDVTSLVAALAIAIPIAVFLSAKYLIHNVLWHRERWYDGIMLAAFALLGAMVALGAADVPVEYVIATSVLVPIVLVAPTERRARAMEAS